MAPYHSSPIEMPGMFLQHHPHLQHNTSNPHMGIAAVVSICFSTVPMSLFTLGLNIYSSVKFTQSPKN